MINLILFILTFQKKNLESSFHTLSGCFLLIWTLLQAAAEALGPWEGGLERDSCKPKTTAVYLCPLTLGLPSPLWTLRRCSTSSLVVSDAQSGNPAWRRQFLPTAWACRHTHTKRTSENLLTRLRDRGITCKGSQKLSQQVKSDSCLGSNFPQG